MANKSWSWEDHKYISKEYKNGKWIYNYGTSEKEDKNTQTNNVPAKIQNKIESTANKITTSLNNVKQKIEATKINDTVKKSIDITVANNKNTKLGDSVVPEWSIALHTGLAIVMLLAASVAGIVRAIKQKKEINKYAKVLSEEVNSDNSKQFKAAKTANQLDFVSYEKSKNAKEVDQAACNPKYRTGSLEYQMNCGSCSLAYDMRRRGYDVEAKPDNDGEEESDLLRCYKDAKTIDVTPKKPQSGFTSIESEKLESNILDTYKNGTYGIMNVQWTPPGFAGGHSMIFEIENNKIIVRDCQNNKTYSFEDITKNVGLISFTQTNNLKINKDMMDKYVKMKGENNVTK